MKILLLANLEQWIITIFTDEKTYVILNVSLLLIVLALNILWRSNEDTRTN